MRPALHKVKAVVEHPATRLATGAVLLASGLASAYYDLTSAERTFRWGVHHGVLLWGIVQMLGSLPDLVEGIDRTIQAAEHK
ncbi:MAG TPA: hypothetical protein VFB96_25140 [Pirellulaceae bacterium]|nr:hypothetical protein [Pirellulaceae bacterium]